MEALGGTGQGCPAGALHQPQPQAAAAQGLTPTQPQTQGNDIQNTRLLISQDVGKIGFRQISLNI